MNFLKAFFINIACIPLYLVSVLIPRDPKLWIFGAWFGHRYSDNPRYVYEYLNHNREKTGIRPVWLSREPKIVSHLREAGYEAYEVRSLKGYWLSCRASAVFVSCGQEDVNLVGASRALKVNLWHGIPLKKIKADDTNSRYSQSGRMFRMFRWIWMRLFPFDAERWDLIVTSGPEMTRRLSSAFRGFMSQQGRIVELGNPRADHILSAPSLDAPKKLLNKYGTSRLVCYAPTFRGKSNTLDLFSGLDAEKLHRILQKHDAILLAKLHFYDRERAANSTPPNRIYILSDEELEDINTLLPHVDILITDYSSVFFDFLLLNRPILFFPYDLDSYLNFERNFYEDYNKAACGPICQEWDCLQNTLEKTLSGIDEFAAERKAQQARFFTYMDTNNAERIVNYVSKLLTT